MAPPLPREFIRPAASYVDHSSEEHNEEDGFALGDFEEEMKRLLAANQQLMDDLHATDSEEEGTAPHPPLSETEELVLLRLENKELKARIEELLGSVQSTSEQSEDVWVERQREYEMLLEEKSEVIRSLHQKIQELQEGDPEPSRPPSVHGTAGVGQAEEILRLKRELEEQRNQLKQDEQDMMDQMRQMELTMARERAEMARHRQEVARLQADLTREIEQSSRDPGLRERLQNLRRPDSKSSAALVAPPLPKPDQKPSEATPPAKSSGLLKRFFG